MSELHSDSGVLLAGLVGLRPREMFVEAFIRCLRRLQPGAGPVKTLVPGLEEPLLGVERQPATRRSGRGMGCRIAG